MSVRDGGDVDAVEAVTGSSIVAGRAVAGEGPVARAVDPRTAEPTGPDVPEVGPAQVREAVAAATAAAAVLGRATREQTADLLEAVAGEIEAVGDVLVARADAETALGVTRLIGERGRTCGQLRMFADAVRRGDGVRAIHETADPQATPPRPELRRVHRPVGPVAVFGASNFPLAFSVAGGDTASALAARCPVVVKAHPSHPGTSEIVGRAVARAVAASGLPAGTFSLLQGHTPDVGRRLVEDPGIVAVGFTGSGGVGRALFDLAAARPVPIPVYAEMGSTNPVVLTPEALDDDLAGHAARLAASVVGGWGQFCTKPGLLLAPADRADEVRRALIDAIGTADPGYLLSKGVRDGLRRRVAEIRDVDGVVVDEAHPGTGVGLGHPALVAGCAARTLRDHAAMREELFGPVTVVVAVDGVDDVVATLDAIGGTLTGTLVARTEDDPWAGRALEALVAHAGRVLLGGVPTGVAVTAAQHHGGPYPATTSSLHTSVGTAAIGRFLRPVALQDVPEALAERALGG